MLAMLEFIVEGNVSLQFTNLGKQEINVILTWL